MVVTVPLETEILVDQQTAAIYLQSPSALLFVEIRMGLKGPRFCSVRLNRY